MGRTPGSVRDVGTDEDLLRVELWFEPGYDYDEVDAATKEREGVSQPSDGCIVLLFGLGLLALEELVRWLA